MTKDEIKMLTEKEELLLSRHFDGECGFISRFQAQRLLIRNDQAKLFFNGLSAVGAECRAISSEAKGVDLWSRIDSRITAEESAAFYLGERRSAPTTELAPAFKRIRLNQALFGGLSGAAVAATLLIILAQPAAKDGKAAATLATLPQPFKQAALGALDSQPIRFNRRDDSTLEVDWMRANGPLKLLQNPSGKSAVIWVRRKNIPTATLRAVDIPPVIEATPHLGLGVIPLDQLR